MERNSGKSSGLTSLPLTSCSSDGAASSRIAAMAVLQAVRRSAFFEPRPVRYADRA